MDKIIDRFGLFDLWVELFPGAIAALGSILFIEILYKILYGHEFKNSVIQGSALNWIASIITSLFLGIILQEIGRWIRKVANYRNATYGILDPNAGIFSQHEIFSFRLYFTQHGWDGKNIKDGNSIFHRINAEAQECAVAGRYVKLNVIQNMSFSLSAAMLLEGIETFIIVVTSLIMKNVSYALIATIVAILCFVLLFVFYWRGKRYNRFWVRSIVYAMAVKIAENEENGESIKERN